jgi:hypothetical protein
VFLLEKVPISPKLVLYITVKKRDLEVCAVKLETRTYSLIVVSLCRAPEAEV